jgi:hypothetical protein
MVVRMEREHLQTLCRRRRHQRCERAVDLAWIDGDVTQAELLAQCERDVLFDDEPASKQVLSEADSLGRSAVHRGFELFAAEPPLTDEDRAKLLAETCPQLLDHRRQCHEGPRASGRT